MCKIVTIYKIRFETPLFKVNGFERFKLMQIIVYENIRMQFYNFGNVHFILDRYSLWSSVFLVALFYFNYVRGI